MLEQINDFINQRVNFAFETTLSGKGYAPRIPKWQTYGYQVKLFFLQLPDAEFAINRVQQRVSLGGHDIPEKTIRRRFSKGLQNFQALYRPLVDEWAVYDNSGSIPILLDEGKNNASTN
jgi:predicted ABC-type ATPase